MDGGGDKWGYGEGPSSASFSMLNESSFNVTGSRMSTTNFSFMDRPSFASDMSSDTITGKSQSLVRVPGELYGAFYRILHRMGSRLQVFEVLDEWMVQLESVIGNAAMTGTGQGAVVELLRKEWETWDLIRSLYFPRLSEEDDASTPVDTNNTTLMDSLSLNGSSKKVEINDEFHLDDKTHLEAILKGTKELQEMKLILAWLEANYARRVGEPSMEAKDIAWEHTLDTLKKNAAVGKKNAALVTSIDPDVVSRTEKALHPLDAAEEERIMRGVFSYLRRGDKDAALAFLVEAGHPQKAFALFGSTPASLFKPSTNSMDEDEEEDEEPSLLYGSGSSEKVGIREEYQDNSGSVAGEYPPESGLAPKVPSEFRVTGNSMRDLWQSVAWQICESKNKLSKFDRAAYGALLPHTGVLLEVAATWEDKLWARVKGSVETRLEEELRASHVDRGKWERLPAEFWEQGEGLSDILRKVDLIDNVDTHVDEYSDRIVTSFLAAFLALQKAAMVNGIEGFLNYMDENIEALLTLRDTSRDEENDVVDQFVRFLIHVLLFFAIVELPYSEGLTNIAAEAFIRVLVRAGEFESTPFYLQKLSGDDVKAAVVASQIDVLNAAKGSEDESLLTYNEIREFLSNALANEIPLLLLSEAVVEKYREDATANGVPFHIQALEWLRCSVDLADNAEDALSALVSLLRSVLVAARGFLLAGSIDKTDEVITLLTSQDLSDLVSAAPQATESIVREFVCYKELMEAEKAYSIWRKSFGNKPTANKGRGGGDGDRDKWDKATSHHAKAAVDGMLEVLKFPGGWLKDVYPTGEDDATAVDAVRRVVLKKVVFIILNLLTSQETLSVQFFPYVRSFARILTSNEQGILSVLSVDDVRAVFKSIESATRKAEPNLLLLPK